MLTFKKSIILIIASSTLLSSPVVISGPIGLVDLYLSAEKKDAELEKSQLDRDINFENIAAVKADLKPKISLTSNASLRRHSESIYDLESLNAGVSLNQPLYSPQTQSQLNIVNHQVAKSELNHTVTKNRLMLSVIQSYFRVLTTHADLQIIMAKLEADQAQYQQTKISNLAGINSRTDLLEAKSNLDKTIADKISYQNSYENALESLETLTGRLIPEVNALNISSQVDLDNLTLIQALESGMQQSNSIAIALRDIDEARENIMLQKQINKPSVNLNLHYAYQDYQGFSEPMESQYKDRHRVEVGLAITMPIYDGGFEDAKVTQASLKLKQSHENLRQTKEQTELLIKQAVRNISKSLAQIKALNIAKESSLEYLKASEVTYESGLRDLVDVLNARTAFTQSERQLIAAQYNLIYEKTYLRMLIGDLDIEDLAQLDALLTNPIKLK